MTVSSGGGCRPPERSVVASERSVDAYVQYSTSKLEDYDPREFDDFDLDLFEGFPDEVEPEDLRYKDLDISVVWYYHKLIYPSQDYLEYLDYLRQFKDSEDFPLPAGGKITGFKVFDHGEGQVNLWVPEIETDKYNPCSKFASIRSSASRTARKLSNLQFVENIDKIPKLVKLDLTFPKGISNLLKGSGQGDVTERYWDCLKLFFDKLSTHVGFDKLGSQVNLHVWKTELPFSPHAHFHANILWVKDSPDGLVPLDEWRVNKPLNVDKVRELWKDCIEESFNVSLDTDVDIFLKWIPLSDKAKLIHRLKYTRRKPLTDLAEYYEDHEFDPEDLDDGFNSYLMEYSNQSRCFGIWTNLKQFLKNSVNVEDVDICPLCGKKVEDVYSRSVDEFWVDALAFVSRDGSLTWDPPP